MLLYLDVNDAWIELAKNTCSFPRLSLFLNTCVSPLSLSVFSVALDAALTDSAFCRMVYQQERGWSSARKRPATDTKGWGGRITALNGPVEHWALQQVSAENVGGTRTCNRSDILTHRVQNGWSFILTQWTPEVYHNSVSSHCFQSILYNFHTYCIQSEITFWWQSVLSSKWPPNVVAFYISNNS